EFGRDEYLELKTYAKALGIIFFSTPFDFKSVDFLEELDMPLYKIASADCTNTPLIKYVVETGKPVIVSTGGTSWREIDLVEELLNDNCAILHCVSSYPTQPEEMNLNIIPMMIERYDLEIGLSDHYNGICMAEAAYVLGATIIEKHFTLNHSWRGSDHALSLEPQGLESLVNNINRIKLALGDTEKYVLPSEKAAISKLGKSIWPKYHIKAGTLLGECDFDIKSPGGGLPPYRIYDVEGKVSVNDLSTCNPLQEGDYK
ncbi:MAG: N-acetylneuraminate synthase family protein, partial [Candidatus Omnitrophica bacterium]|nr:N-acetylneuraminate synthase family protein [Candidatus Omnitrophota bacterium]